MRIQIEEIKARSHACFEKAGLSTEDAQIITGVLTETEMRGVFTHGFLRLERYGEQVAGIIIGPCDMAVSMGYGLDVNADPMIDNITKTIAVCKKHGKSCGIFMNDDNVAERWHKEGMNIYWVGTELTMLGAEIARIKCRIEAFE